MSQLRWSACIFAVCALPGFLMAQGGGTTAYDAAIQNAKSLISNNRLADGAAESVRAIGLNGSGWEGYALAGIAYAKMNDCPAAVSYFQSALRLAPDQNRNGIQSSLNACGGSAIAQRPSLPVNNAPPLTIKQARRAPVAAPTVKMPLRSALPPDVQRTNFQGVDALAFKASYYCRVGMALGQVGTCGDGTIYVSQDSVAFEGQGDCVIGDPCGRIEETAPRSKTTFKIEGGRQGDTFSVYFKGKRFRFGGAAKDSPFVSLLGQAIADFPAAAQ